MIGGADRVTLIDIMLHITKRKSGIAQNKGVSNFTKDRIHCKTIGASIILNLDCHPQYHGGEAAMMVKVNIEAEY